MLLLNNINNLNILRKQVKYLSDGLYFMLNQGKLVLLFLNKINI